MLIHDINHLSLSSYLYNKMESITEMGNKGPELFSSRQRTPTEKNIDMAAIQKTRSKLTTAKSGNAQYCEYVIDPNKETDIWNQNRNKPELEAKQFNRLYSWNIFNAKS
ncbi:hypothetical protein GWI33_003163 [Rhynchophorus ferrugineus]|uniref:Uncharacterized protein n=1 Tax=Rhynchophorus ferrugineus TaxID=354439 RepID=A0A834IVK7_RHYFE|nr:hypothetical protein GWI33_003163 [Rhynchophorus ferrugineus]